MRFLQTHHAHLRRLAARYADRGPGPDADDLFQEAALAVVRCPPGRSDAYLYAVAHNAIRQVLRWELRRKRSGVEVVSLGFEPEALDGGHQRVDDQDDLARLLARVSGPQRLLLVRWSQGWRRYEVARELGKVKSWATREWDRAMAVLREDAA